MRKAIKERNFSALAELTMRDSNQLHAICMDSFPPINYLNETSKKIMDLVHRYNGQMAEKKLAYTFDAGPNAVLITKAEWLDDVCALVEESFKPDDVDSKDWYMFGSVEHYKPEIPPPKIDGFEGPKCGVKFAIVTQIGRGPYIIEEHFSTNEEQSGSFPWTAAKM